MADQCGVDYIAEEILNDERFLKQSGSHLEKAHHYGEGGLIKHTYEVCHIAMQMYDFYYALHPKLNFKVLFIAALYHDYGKVWDYDFNDSTNKYEANLHRRKIHHIQRSAIEWERIAQYRNLSEIFTEEVTHCILSHHGQREWGSPVAPLTREAWILHLSDSMSARVDDCDRIDLSTIKNK